VKVAASGPVEVLIGPPVSIEFTVDPGGKYRIGQTFPPAQQPVLTLRDAGDNVTTGGEGTNAWVELSIHTYYESVLPMTKEERAREAAGLESDNDDGHDDDDGQGGAGNGRVEMDQIGKSVGWGTLGFTKLPSQRQRSQKTKAVRGVATFAGAVLWAGGHYTLAARVLAPGQAGGADRDLHGGLPACEVVSNPIVISPACIDFDKQPHGNKNGMTGGMPFWVQPIIKISNDEGNEEVCPQVRARRAGGRAGGRAGRQTD
jgi:hypothetical protein